MEGGRNSSVADIDFDALAGKDRIEVIEVEGGVVSFEERLELEELAMDAFGMETGCEGLAVTIILVTRGAGGCAGGAAGMIGVELGGE